MAVFSISKSNTNHRINLFAQMTYKTHQVVVPALTITLNTERLQGI